MNTNNFVTARTLRRRIMKSLQEQQRQDSACSEHLRLAISRHTRTILTIVSDLLMNYTKSNLTDQDRALFFKLTPTWLTPELWLQTRIQECEAALELARIEGLLNSAETEFSRVAPFGQMVTGWFSSPLEKQQINSAKATRDRLRRECERAESNHQAKLAQIHAYAEQFLRNAMSAEGIALLLEQPNIWTKLQNALEAMSRDVTALWLDHTRTQSDSLEDVRSATSELLAIHQVDQMKAQTPLLGAANAATRN